MVDGKVDTVKMTQNVASDPGLQCLPSSLACLNTYSKKFNKSLGELQFISLKKGPEI